ncbi:MAG: hypothetical protein ACRCTQ_01200 [Brevinemataceae bacterium]
MKYILFLLLLVSYHTYGQEIRKLDRIETYFYSTNAAQLSNTSVQSTNTVETNTNTVSDISTNQKTVSAPPVENVEPISVGDVPLAVPSPPMLITNVDAKPLILNPENYKESNTNILTDTNSFDQSLPEVPQITVLPDLDIVSSIITPEISIENIKERFLFQNSPYQGSQWSTPTDAAIGVWWRFYSQTTSLFNIPAVTEEILSIESNGKSVWIQDVKTPQTLQSQSQRLLNIAEFNLFGYQFFVFYYQNQDPTSQEVRERQGFFVRILEKQGYMQMSKSTDFEPSQSIYWRRFPSK